MCEPGRIEGIASHWGSLGFGGNASVHKENVGLDVVRGLAAFLVVLGHTRNFVGEGLRADLTASIWQKLLLLPTSFAQESVALFFVLSGYLVGGQVLRELREGRFLWRIYLSKRLSRLWTVLIPGILVTFAVDSLSVRLFPSVWSKVAGGPVDAVTAACNVVFLQRTRCSPYGSNDSLWSLAYEFWFYILFAAVAAFAWGIVRRQWAALALGLLVAAGAVGLFGIGLLSLMPAWLLGTCLAVLHARWKAKRIPAWFLLSRIRMLYLFTAVTVAGMLLSNLISPPEWLRFLIVGVACAPLILLTAVAPWGGGSLVAKRIASLGLISFSLYVFHLPLVKFIVGLLSGTGGFGALGNIVSVYAVAALVAVCCVPLWSVTERHTGRVRDRLLGLMGAKPKPLHAE
ncbi:acyltransferase family protein [Arthrobacter sedimenti]|uniref:Acyltransferase family protein n=1 Tax=Arthrobacter sedimenti TaxID=2694931 RepID=A0ABV8WEM3_9MICC